jgi:hypothetical protein
MKKALFGLIILSAFVNYSCASEGYNTQKGALIGAIGGALAGQAIGHNTAGTLIGVAGGALAGAIAGNAVDQSQARERLVQASMPANVPPPPPEEAPPGEWVEVPGAWVNGRWVPAHRAWVPVNPDGSGGQVSASPEYTPPPAYAIEAPPPVVPIPGTYVYYVPDIGADILFYHGHWYRPYAGRWYRAGTYKGPWGYLAPRMVPGAIRGLPPDYRRGIPPGYRPVHHVDLQRNWQRWERERYWDHHRERR